MYRFAGTVNVHIETYTVGSHAGLDRYRSKPGKLYIQKAHHFSFFQLKLI